MKLGKLDQLVGFRSLTKCQRLFYRLRLDGSIFGSTTCGKKYHLLNCCASKIFFGGVLRDTQKTLRGSMTLIHSECTMVSSKVTPKQRPTSKIPTKLFSYIYTIIESVIFLLPGAFQGIPGLDLWPRPVNALSNGVRTGLDKYVKVRVGWWFWVHPGGNVTSPLLMVQNPKANHRLGGAKTL